MEVNKEIDALFKLLDDSDEDVVNSVSQRLIHFGKDIIPNLESFWEQTEDNEVQSRIESIIHKVHFRDVEQHLIRWNNSDRPSLLYGAILLAKYRFPDLNEDNIRKTVKSIYQSCWLELNNYLTPLEQVNIINSIFYSMYKFQGVENEESKANHFFINEVIDSHQGNTFSLGILYQLLAEMLDIPVFMIEIPRQYLLAYYQTDFDFMHRIERVHEQKIQFYIDPCNGTIYTQNDVDAYLRKYNLVADKSNFLPLTNKEIIASTIDALRFTYEEAGLTNNAEEMAVLLSILER